MPYTVDVEKISQIWEGMHDQYIKGVQRAFYTDVWLYNKIFGKAKTDGRQYIILYQIGGNIGGEFVAERATLPLSRGRKFLRGSDATRYGYFPLDLTGPELYQAAGEGQFMNVVGHAYSDMEKNGKWFLETVLWGDGSGRIAQVNGTPTISGGDTVITVDQRPVFHVKEYQPVNYGTDSTEYEVLSVDVVNGTFTLDGDVRTEFADNVWVYRNGAYQSDLYSEPLGLLAHVNSSNPPYTSSTYQGLNRSTAGHEFLQAYMKNQSSAAMTMLSFKQYIDTIGQKCGGEVPTNLVTEPGVYNSYYLLLMSLHQNINAVVDKAGLTAALQFVYNGKGIPLEVTNFCPSGYMYALNSKYFDIRESRPLGWDQTLGNPKMQRSQTQDVFIGRMCWYFNTTCTNNQAQGVWYAIKRNDIT